MRTTTRKYIGKNLFILILSLTAAHFIPVTVYGQEPKAAMPADGKWIRVQSDNGEFSVEIPDEYSHFYDKEGFHISSGSNEATLKEMRVVNSYREGTLLSFEAYKVKHPRIALEMTLESEKSLGKFEKLSRNGFVVHQVAVKNEKYYMVRQYFVSDDYFYVLTAGAHEKETEAIKRFFRSVRYPEKNKLEKLPEPGVLTIPFLELKKTPIMLGTKNAVSGRKTKEPPKKDNIVPPVKPAIPKFVIIAKPRAYYTTPARMNAEEGSIQLRMTFAPTGGFLQVDVVARLEYGLLKQAIMAAMRLKFLPVEKEGKPEPHAATIQYGFTIY